MYGTGSVESRALPILGCMTWHNNDGTGWRRGRENTSRLLPLHPPKCRSRYLHAQVLAFSRVLFAVEVELSLSFFLV